MLLMSTLKCSYSIIMFVTTPPQSPLWPGASPKPGRRRRVGDGVQIPPPSKIDEWNALSFTWNAGEGEWLEKHRDMEGEGDGRQHGRKPRISEPESQDIRASPNSLETHLIIIIIIIFLYCWKKCGTTIRITRKWGGHWTPTGTEPTKQWRMDGSYSVQITVLNVQLQSNGYDTLAWRGIKMIPNSLHIEVG